MIDRASSESMYPQLNHFDSIGVLGIALLGGMECTCICNNETAPDELVALDLGREIQSLPDEIVVLCKTTWTT